MGLRAARLGTEDSGWTAIAANDTDEGNETRGGEAGFKGRLDQLLSDALTEQAREQAAFMRVLQSSRDALAAARVELDAVRAFVEARDKEMLRILDERLSAVAQDGSVVNLEQRLAALESEQNGLKRMLSVKLEAIAGSVEAIEWRTREALSERTQAMESRLTELAGSLEARQQEVAGAMLQALEPIARIMQIVQSRVTTAAAELTDVQARLFQELSEREDHLEARQDAAIAALLTEFGSSLKPRDRARTATVMKEADEKRRRQRDDAKAAAAVPAAPVPAAPASPNPASAEPAASAPASGGWGRRRRNPDL